MITLVIFVLSLVIFFIKCSAKDKKYLKNVPGPKPNIFFGNLLDFLFVPVHGYLDKFMNYLKTYGPTVLLHDGPLSRGVITEDVKFIEHILSSTKLIKKASQYEFLHSWLGTGLVTSDGTKWKERRRMLTPSFHFSILNNFVDIFDSVGDVFVEKLKNEVGKSSVDITPLVSLMTMDSICEAAMGTKINAQNNESLEYVKKVKVMCAILTERMLSLIHPLLYPLTINSFHEKRALKVLHAHTDDIIEKRINESKEEEDENVDGKKKKLAFLDILLKSTVNGKPLSRLDIREEVDTFMFEGHDTISAAVTFAMYSLAMHPEIQEKLFSEQKQIFENVENFNHPRPTIQQLQEMKYLELVIKETLRLYPSVPYIGRTLTEDVEWDGNIYPKGLNIMLYTFAVHRNPKYFSNPSEFIPERFNDMKLVNPYVYTPFSAGPRNCIGQKFAMLELKSILSKIVRNFKLLPAKPAHTLKLAPETVLVSKNGVNISIENRIFS